MWETPIVAAVIGGIFSRSVASILAGVGSYGVVGTIASVHYKIASKKRQTPYRETGYNLALKYGDA